MNFVDQPFTIARVGLDGLAPDKEEVGVIAEGTGLGYYYTLDEAGDEVYIPTHLPSGFAMGPRFYREADARAYIEKAASMADWENLTAKEIHEMSPDLKARIGGITADVCGGNMNIAHRVSRRSKHQRELIKHGVALAIANQDIKID